ncbi:MAG: hypothetical protein WCG06_04800, partial [Candidatus Omnitrophota bacterium]
MPALVVAARNTDAEQLPALALAYGQFMVKSQGYESWKGMTGPLLALFSSGLNKIVYAQLVKAVAAGSQEGANQAAQSVAARIEQGIDAADARSLAPVIGTIVAGQVREPGSESSNPALTVLCAMVNAASGGKLDEKTIQTLAPVFSGALGQMTPQQQDVFVSFLADAVKTGRVNIQNAASLTPLLLSAHEGLTAENANKVFTSLAALTLVREASESGVTALAPTLAVLARGLTEVSANDYVSALDRALGDGTVNIKNACALQDTLVVLTGKVGAEGLAGLAEIVARLISKDNYPVTQDLLTMDNMISLVVHTGSSAVVAKAFLENTNFNFVDRPEFLDAIANTALSFAGGLDTATATSYLHRVRQIMGLQSMNAGNGAVKELVKILLSRADEEAVEAFCESYSLYGHTSGSASYADMLATGLSVLPENRSYTVSNELLNKMMRYQDAGELKEKLGKYYHLPVLKVLFGNTAYPVFTKACLLREWIDVLSKNDNKGALVLAPVLKAVLSDYNVDSATVSMLADSISLSLKGAELSADEAVVVGGMFGDLTRACGRDTIAAAAVLKKFTESIDKNSQNAGVILQVIDYLSRLLKSSEGAQDSTTALPAPSDAAKQVPVTPEPDKQTQNQKTLPPAQEMALAMGAMKDIQGTFTGHGFVPDAIKGLTGMAAVDTRLMAQNPAMA